jgi:glycosyltransferase involved in cell wall biosynthesis
MRVLLVDPSLFTAPYDAALTEGLVAAGIMPTWAVRPVRVGDRQLLADEHVDAFFYRRVDQLGGALAKVRSAAKGIAHAVGLVRLVGRVLSQRPDVVHFQWTLVPLLDSLAIAVIRLVSPVVLTVHDTTPFNGDTLSRWQSLAFDLAPQLSDRVIVHTQAGRTALVSRGIRAEKISVVAHGPLPLNVAPSAAARGRVDKRWTFVLFGELKPYKGLDILIEALGRLPAASLKEARVIVAGRPQMDLSPVLARIAELELGAVVELRAARLSEQEMADLFAHCDCFLFPYRQIDASGVYFLVKSLSKWLIASRVGVFAEDLREQTQGVLVPPGDVEALAAAIADAISQRPSPTAAAPARDWTEIGARTRRVYEAAKASHRTAPPQAAEPSVDAQP